MGALIITTRTQATRHGVFAELRTPPAVARAVNPGVACLVDQFPWGPAQQLYTPDTTGDLIQTVAPFGSSHQGAGYLALIRKRYALLKVVRVMAATGTAPATYTVNKTGPAALIVITLKYNGTMGNSVTCQVTTATDGDANHFNIIVQLTGATGTTVDKIENYNVSGTGADTDPTTDPRFPKCALIGTITKSSSGVPIIASGSFSGGTDGTVAASDYVGTEGTGNRGFALLEGDRSIRQFFVGDPGDSFRAAVNAGAYAHAAFMTDRRACINGPSGQTSAAARTDAALYSSRYVSYADPWLWINDDTTGARRLVPPAPFLASLCSLVSPSTSPAWKSPEMGDLLSGIVALEADRGDAAGLNTAAGVCTFIRELSGGFRLEAGVNTCAPADPAAKRITYVSMAIYIASTLTEAFRPMVDGPNVELTQQRMIDTTVNFLQGLKNNKNNDPEHNPYITDYSIDDLGQFNPANDLSNGDFTLPISVQVDAGMERIFLSFNLTTGTVLATAA